MAKNWLPNDPITPEDMNRWQSYTDNSGELLDNTQIVTQINGGTGVSSFNRYITSGTEISNLTSTGWIDGTVELWTDFNGKIRDLEAKYMVSRIGTSAKAQICTIDAIVNMVVDSSSDLSPFFFPIDNFSGAPNAYPNPLPLYYTGECGWNRINPEYERELTDAGENYRRYMKIVPIITNTQRTRIYFFRPAAGASTMTGIKTLDSANATAKAFRFKIMYRGILTPIWASRSI